MIKRKSVYSVIKDFIDSIWNVVWRMLVVFIAIALYASLVLLITILVR